MPSNQTMFCNSYGNEFETNFTQYDGRFCCSSCQQEYIWRQTLSALDKSYRKSHSSKEKEKVAH